MTDKQENELFQWFPGLLSYVYKDIETSLEYFWPSTDKWPHENLILVSLVRYAKEFDAFVYPECSMQTSAGNIRRDLILISQKLRLVLQCEFKHFWQYDPVIRDLERVRDTTVLHTFLRAGGILDDVFEYDWCGLFLGFGHIHNSFGEIWKSAKSAELSSLIAERIPEHEKEKMITFAEFQKGPRTQSGLMTATATNIPEKKQFWLAYFLQELEK